MKKVFHNVTQTCTKRPNKLKKQNGRQDDIKGEWRNPWNTSIEPKKKRFLLRFVSGFKEPIEECLSMALVYSHIPSKLLEFHRGLPGQSDDSVCLLESQDFRAQPAWLGASMAQRKNHKEKKMIEEKQTRRGHSRWISGCTKQTWILPLVNIIT